MKYICIVTVLLALFGCASDPLWMNNVEEKAVKISWHKGAIDAPFVVDEVCHVFSPDKKDALAVLGDQIKLCFDGVAPKQGEGVRKEFSVGGAKVIPIIWHRTEHQYVPRRYVDIYGMPKLHSRGRKNLHHTVGFYFYSNDVCHFVASDIHKHLSTVGHEVKHCFDLDFHDANGNWLMK